MKKFFLCLYFIVLSISIYSQDTLWYLNKPIETLVFEGLKNIPKEKLQPIIDAYKGKIFTDDLFLDLQTKLYALDYFDEFYANAKNADDKFDKVIIEFSVIERSIIEKIIVQGNNKVRQTDILNEVITQINEPYKRAKVKMDKNSVKLLYTTKGYPDASVDVTVIKNKSNNKCTVVFKIDEGNQLVISKINFIGNTFFSDLTLSTKIKTKIKNAFSDGLFSQEKIDEDKKIIVDMYKERGYIKAAVTDVKTDIRFNEDKKRNEIELSIYISEGFQYTFGDFSIRGNKLYKNEDLLKYVTLKKGDILNYKIVERSYSIIADIYYNDGFIYNTINLIDKVDDDNLLVNFEINIVERMRAHIEKITIQGNVKTQLNIIMRELPFEVGDVFSKQKIGEGLRNLMGLGYFKDVKVETPSGTKDGLMELVIIVEENQNKDIRFGLNFSGSVYESPVQLFLQWNDTNLLGKGHNLGVSTNLSTTTQSLNLNFSDNWIGGERVYLGGYLGFSHSTRSRILQDVMTPTDSGVPDPYEGYYVYKYDKVDEDGNLIHKAGEQFVGVPTKEEIDNYSLVTDYDYARYIDEPINDEYYMNYESFSFNIGATTGYTWSTILGRLSLSTGPGFVLEYFNYDETLYRPYSQYLRDNLRQAVFNNKWNLTFSWDYRDNVTMPNNGFLFKQSFTYNGGLMLGNTHFNKSRTSFEGYIRLFDVNVKDVWSYKNILKLKTNFSVIMPQYMYDFGSKKWRDSNESDLTTNDLLFTDNMNVMRGWDIKTDLYAIWQSMIELQMPFYEQYVWGDVFFEATGIWDDYNSLNLRNVANSKKLIEDNFYFTIGAGVRLTVPGLPVAFYLAKRFKLKDGVAVWQKGNGFNGALDYIISFNYDY